MQAEREPDAQLVDASRRGDRAAFAQLVERYQRAVYAVSLSQVHDRALCDDITQDTFVMAWRRLPELRDPARVPAWLCGIARNLARDARKRRRFEAGEPASEPAAASTPFDALSNAESDRMLALALEAIPDKYREPLVLFYYEQQSAAEVGRALGISEATAHQRLSRGRTYLAARMTELVEHGLSRRGPKPELVAAVVAAIGILAPATHVDAHPVAKGSTMLRKLVVVGLCTLTAGTVAVSAGGATSPANPAPARAPTKPPASPPASKPAPPAPAPSATAASRPAKARAVPTLPAGSATIEVPTCEAVATHMSGLALAKLDKVGKMQAKKRAVLEERFLSALLRDCKANAWSENVRLCMTDADDYEQAQNECTDEHAATAEEIAGLPPELQCSALAEHYYTLANAPDGRFTMYKQKVAQYADRIPKIESLALAAKANVAKRCDQGPWSIDHRKCVAAAATEAAYDACD